MGRLKASINTNYYKYLFLLIFVFNDFSWIMLKMLGIIVSAVLPTV
jgi:hypothetical protein